MALKIVIPMPDFSLRSINEFKAAGDMSRPNELMKEFKDRFPPTPNVPTQPKGLATDVGQAITEPDSIDGSDWNFIDKTRLQRLTQETDNRFEGRRAHEEAVQELFVEELTQAREKRMQRAFEKAADTAYRQRQIIADAREAVKNQTRFQEEKNVEMQMEEKRKAEALRFAQSESPTKVTIARATKELLTNPSVTQQKVMYLLQQLETKGIVTQKDRELQRRLKLQLNQILVQDKYALGSEAQILERAIYTQKDMHKAQLSHEFNLTRLQKELNDEYFNYKMEQLALSDDIQEKLRQRRKIAETYRQHEDNERAVYDHKDATKLYSIKQRTVAIPNDPTKFSTKYSLAKFLATADDLALEKSQELTHQAIEKQIKEKIALSHELAFPKRDISDHPVEVRTPRTEMFLDKPEKEFRDLRQSHESEQAVRRAAQDDAKATTTRKADTAVDIAELPVRLAAHDQSLNVLKDQQAPPQPAAAPPVSDDVPSDAVQPTKQAVMQKVEKKS